MKSDHMWFGYESRNVFKMHYGRFFVQPGGTMKVSFRIHGRGEKLEVRKCGVRLVEFLT